MKRLGTALVALLALVALAGAAGTFDAVQEPSFTDEETPVDGPKFTDVPPPTGAPGGADDSAARHSPTETAAGAGDSGGVSPIVVPTVVGSLFASALFAVFLTGDDERAPDAPAATDDAETGPEPTVEPDYDSPGENAVARAWQRLRGRVDADDETATPGEVAARALDRRLPDEPVSTLTDEFRAVRYGDEPATDERVSNATDAAATLSEAGAPPDDQPDSPPDHGR
ncbi:DUF4129 domain-containing protein [Halosimplex salinum]|uniref:DUF4129 domain-containing protein n=1 Tax=Halosimplex salinum TaxID=1710538 RepID=UPI000F48ECED|nr:DUF4129 domain-containing protein [Halosimplex salinum]